MDAAQLAPHRRINLAADGVDYLAFSGHKLYAPFGAGVLVGRPDWLDAGTPHLAGGGAVSDARLDTVSWTTGPARHEGGSPNVLGAATLARATQVIAALDQTQWHDHEDAIRSFLVEGLRRIDGVSVHQIFSDTDTEDHGQGAGTIGVVNFSVAGYDAGLVAAYLSAEHGIGLRDGRFCAHPCSSGWASRPVRCGPASDSAHGSRMPSGCSPESRNCGRPASAGTTWWMPAAGCRPTTPAATRTGRRTPPAPPAPRRATWTE